MFENIIKNYTNRCKNGANGEQYTTLKSIYNIILNSKKRGI